MKVEDRCNCKAWKKNIPKLQSASIMMWNHGMEYTGDVFQYCPWCGKKLAELKEGE